jgi:6-phosphofructokinase 1
MIKYAIDSIRDTASSYGRAFVVETMGRGSGYLALVSALSSGAEMCLIPELSYDLDAYKNSFLKQKENGRRYFLSIIAEGIGKTMEIVEWFEKEIGIEATPMVLGHIQRGGNPTVYDRLMAFHFVTNAIDGLLEGKTDSVVCYNDGGFGYRSIKEIASSDHTVNNALIELGREYGHG